MSMNTTSKNGRKTRPKPFRWEIKSNWTAEILRFLNDVITPKVIRLFMENPPEYIVSDNLGWLDRIIDRASPSTHRTLPSTTHL